jgi:hypothetical protein
MTAARPARRYVHSGYVEALLPRLSARDWEILASLDRCRVLSGAQVERLHSHPLSPHTRARTRRLVLNRLTGWGVITPLERRIGGIRGGSSGLVFTLDVAGRRLIQLKYPEQAANDQRLRRPWTPGRLFLQHSLSVSELYVGLAEASKQAAFSVDTFQTEPASWWPDGLGGWLKPDAYIMLTGTRRRLHYWAEVDRATESLTTIRAKLSTYLDFLNRGQLGPRDIMPLIVITAPSIVRRDAIKEIVERLPEPATELFMVSLDSGAIVQLTALAAEGRTRQGSIDDANNTA